MKIAKENNQYYGQYFEEAVTSLINKESIDNKTSFHFSTQDIETMNRHAQQLVNTLNAKQAKRVGQNTSNESCDIIIDNQEVELKYVSGGKGTYFNTSMIYLSTLGFKSYHTFLVEHGYIKALKEEFGEMVNENNISPVSNKDSSFIRHTYPDKYKELSAWEGQLRAEFVKEFFTFLQLNPSKKLQFVSDLITKNSSGKHIPDKLIVFNHDTENIIVLDKEDILSLKDNTVLSIKGKYSIMFGNVRVTFAWQNGTGLNNPTLRVFI